MAVDICSEISSPFVSPRISFSHDLREDDILPVESHQARADHQFLSNSTCDFNFCIGQNFSHEITSADELFANGKILPLKIKKIEIHQSDPNRPRKDSTKSHKNNENPNENMKKKRLIEFLSTSFDADEEDDKPLTKPFWQFRRSSSLNCDNGRSTNGGLLRSLHFLTRSNSTGSAPNPNPNPKPSTIPKVMQKQQSMKESSNIRTNPSVYSSNQYFPYYNTPKRPYLKNSSSRSYGNGVRISPVLNIPPTYIAKGTVSLFGIGSFFCSKKSKKKKK